MENWFRENGRPALVDALAEACGRLDQDFTARARSEAQQKIETAAELDLLRVRAAHADHLEQQVQTLKDELARFKRPTQTPLDTSHQSLSPKKNRSTPHRQPRAPLTPVSANHNIRRSIKDDDPKAESLSHAELLGEYAKLDDRHGKLRVQAAETVKANDQLKERLREQKEALNRWKEHAASLKDQNEKQLSKIKQLKARGAATTNDPAFNSSFGADTNIVAPDHPAQDEHGLVSGDSQRTKSPSARINTPADGAPRELSPVAPDHPSRPPVDNTDSEDSQVAEELPLPPLPAVGGLSLEAQVKAEPSSDIPVVVSERSVRKRRREDDSTVDTPTATKVKIEDDSDPEVADEQSRFLPQSSIDFDDRIRPSSTPRRNRAPRAETQLRGNPIVTPFAGSNSAYQRHERDRYPGRSPRRDNHVSGQLPKTECGQEQGHADSGLPVASAPSVDDDRENTSSERLSSAAILAASTPSGKSRPGSGTAHGLGQKIASLAEDEATEEEAESLARQPQKKGLLDTLLHTATPEKSAIDAPSRLRHGGRPLSPLQDLVPRRQPLSGKKGRKPATKAPRLADDPASKSTTKEPPDVAQPNSKPLDGSKKSTKGEKNAAPLRERPRSKLRPEDFKINPKYNDGLDYAYTEVVRNKDERACLSGCVKEACCGAWWRAQALTERDNTSRSAFQTSLEAHLGDDAWRLGTMSAEEKEKMWLQARVQELANTYGKHERHRFQRRTTPPGFFDPDFPSTQEILKGKELAALAEREKVAERWREARKPNRSGRWLFRDE